MAQVFDSIDAPIARWIAAQPVFFVATAPLDPDGCVNCSPKGLDSLRVIGPRELAYLDLTGSGVETIAHLKDNGRIVIMLCAFEGPPKIMRFHGRGEVVRPADAGFAELVAQFPRQPGVRSVIRVHVARISDSCGYGVPLMRVERHREALPKWADTRGESGIVDYQRTTNAQSLDDCPASTGFEHGSSSSRKHIRAPPCVGARRLGGLRTNLGDPAQEGQGGQRFRTKGSVCNRR